MANWEAHFDGFSTAVRAQLLPHAEKYDRCMRERAESPRFLQKGKYHDSAPPMVVSPWHGRSPFDPEVCNLGIAWYVPRCKPVRAYGR